MKPLEALERIRELRQEYASKMPSIEEELSIIETELKRLEELEIENSKQFKEKWVQDNLAMTFELNVANEKLKALEIIKEKRVDVKCLFFSNSLEEYNGTINQRDLYLELTQAEFDLLKEWLNG